MAEVKAQNWKWQTLKALEKKSEDDKNFKLVLTKVFKLRGTFVLELSGAVGLAPSTVLAHCQLLQDLGIVELDPVRGHDPFESYFKLANKGFALEYLLKEFDLL